MRPVFAFFFFVLLSYTTIAQPTTNEYSTRFDSAFYAGKFEGAMQIAKEWEADTRKRFGENSLERAVSLSRIADATKLLGEQADLILSDSLFQVSIRIYTQAGARESAEFVEILRRCAKFKNYTEKFEEGIQTQKEAIGIQSKLKGAEDKSTLTLTAELGKYYLDAGKINEAEKVLSSCYEICQKADLTEDRVYRYILLYYGQIMEFQGRFRQAVGFYEISAQITRRLEGEESIAYLNILYSISYAQRKMGLFEDALSNIQKVKEIAKKIFGETGSFNLAQLEFAQATYQYEMGLEEGMLEKLLAFKGVATKAIGSESTSVGYADQYIALYYLNKNNYEAADSFSKAAIKIYTNSFGRSSRAAIEATLLQMEIQIRWYKFNMADTVLLDEIEGIIKSDISNYTSEFYYFINVKSTWYLYQKDYTSCLKVIEDGIQFSNSKGDLNERELMFLLKTKESVLLGLKQYEEALKITDIRLAYSKKNYQANISFFTDEQRQEMASDFRYDLGIMSNVFLLRPDLGDAGGLLNYSLFTKSILETTARKINAAVQNSGDASTQQLYKDWLYAREQFNTVAKLTPEAAQVQGIDVAQLMTKVEMLESTLARRGFNISRKAKNEDWVDIQNNLKAGEAAADIIRCSLFKEDSFRDTVFYIVSIIQKNTPQPVLVFLENGNELESFVLGQYQNEITRKKDISANLYEKMWAPIAAHLQGVKTIYFSPDGIFHKINLNTLRAADGTYLLDNIQIKQVTNLRNILDRGQETSGTEPGVAALFGNPAFKTGAISAKPDTLANLSSRTPLYRDIAEDAKGDLLLPPLPGSEREVKAIAKKLTSKNWQTAVFTGAKATEDTLKQLKSPKVLHIATHGYFLNSEKTNSTIGLNSPHAGKNPALRSMLFFAGAENSIAGENSGRNDGILTAFEAAVLNLDQTELVVLSACNTGLGKIQNGEGVFGLQRAFRIAGAKSLIMSLWEVEDAATELLMNTFYENWLSGMSKSEAFRKAQLTLKAKYPQPFYWGSFILVNG